MSLLSIIATTTLALGTALAQASGRFVHEPGQRLSLKEVTKLAEDRSLTKLDLRGGGISDQELAVLSKAIWLEELRVDSHTLTSKGYQALKNLKNLKVLGIQSLSSPAEISDVIQLIKDFPLEELDFSGSNTMTGEGLQELNCKKTLKVLDLSCGRGQLTDAGLENLADFTELRSLDLNGHGGIKIGLKALSGLNKLEHLNVYGCHGIKDEAFIPLLENCKTLKHLNMGFCWWHKGEGLVFPASVEHLNLVESKQLTDAAFEIFPCRDRVVHLNLFQCLQMTDKGVLALGRMPRVETLKLGCIRALTNKSLKSIGENISLRLLDISDNDLFTDDGIRNLKELVNLEHLSLWHTKGLKGPGLEILKGMPKLRELNLADCHNLSDLGLEQIKTASSLKALYLDNCKAITDDGIAKLTGNEKLKELTLKGCPQLTDESLKSLEKIRGLTYLDIGNCLNMSNEGRRKIQRALPDCVISL